MGPKNSALRVVGLLAFVVGLVGFLIYGWRFDTGGDPIATTLGVGAALLAILVTLRRRL
ncbi:multidrug transporter [Haladaptatus sp. DJG-WS-42]|uniref:multidrug transporter n=1 Tax=Haladaptatus sp. DJG-WS-42 TaxID=3120516 RepID=UPI0030CDD534